jgi:hypothetical protein
VRERAVRWIVFCTKHWPKIKRAIVHMVSFVAGVMILKREIYDVQHPEPLLVFLGLWLCGIAPATFFDGLRKIGQQAQGQLDEATSQVPKADRRTPTRPEES